MTVSWQHARWYIYIIMIQDHMTCHTVNTISHDSQLTNLSNDAYIIIMITRSRFMTGYTLNMKVSWQTCQMMHTYVYMILSGRKERKKETCTCKWYMIPWHVHMIINNKILTSPTYFWTNSDPMTLIKQASVLLATALAHRVLPVPGGPNKRTPLGGSIPSFTNLSG